MVNDEASDVAPDETSVRCPWCGRGQDLFLEPATDQPEQVFIEECEACGRAFEVDVEWGEDGEPQIQVSRGGGA